MIEVEHTQQEVAPVPAAQPVEWADYNRILIVDDNEAIHQDFLKILGDQDDGDLDSLEAELFGSPAESKGPQRPKFNIESAMQGDTAIEMVQQACAEGRPYSLIFMDVRMPPGKDGIQTTKEILGLDPFVSVVICSAYSDYDWSAITSELGLSDRFLILKKPFEVIEVRQAAHALQRRWALARQADDLVHNLEDKVEQRSRELRTVANDLKEEIEARKKMETELRLAQKLEAVGQLAAGVAHEINTPMQYIGDNVHFLGDCLQELWALMERYRSELHTAVGDDAESSVLKELRETYANLKILNKRKMGKAVLLTSVMNESDQLIAIFTASIKTVRKSR